MVLAFQALTLGHWTARLAGSEADRQASLALRRLCFRTRRGLPAEGEGDAFDAISDHLLIENQGRLMATCRLRLVTAANLGGLYAAQYYDLGQLSPLPALELGRFCLDPSAGSDPSPLRLAFAALARAVDANGAGLLFGCSSFEGTDPAPYQAALAPWSDRLRADCPARPGIQTLALANLAPHPEPQPLPPLLRHYLALGGTLSAQAVIDRDLRTCHVLTCLALADIPPAHARHLRALAAPG